MREPGETARQAAVRELAEETGYQVSRPGPIGRALGKCHPGQDTTLQFTRANWQAIQSDPHRFQALGMRVASTIRMRADDRTRDYQVRDGGITSGLPNWVDHVRELNARSSQVHFEAARIVSRCSPAVVAHQEANARLEHGSTTRLIAANAR